ncbi:MAG: hypothetical protein QOD06_1955 [Candidatus Binatota bacterium]|nr:hypothetical protein [Candidatus Binatota bacterium]
MKEYLFVYGTLRRRHAEIHERFLRTERFVAEGTISGTLYDLGRYPGVHRMRGGRARTDGELFELRDVAATLAALDEYEGSGFRRVRVSVRLDGGRRQRAWAYLLVEAPPAHAREITSGVYR